MIVHDRVLTEPYTGQACDGVATKLKYGLLQPLIQPKQAQLASVRHRLAVADKENKVASLPCTA